MVARPLMPEELLARADLAGYARVVSRRNGHARLLFTRLLKGRPKGPGLWHWLGLSRAATVRLRQSSDRPILGEWSDERAYEPGQKILTHLIWDNDAGVYKTAWWNAVGGV